MMLLAGSLRSPNQGEREIRQNNRLTSPKALRILPALGKKASIFAFDHVCLLLRMRNAGECNQLRLVSITSVIRS